MLCENHVFILDYLNRSNSSEVTGTILFSVFATAWLFPFSLHAVLYFACSSKYVWLLRK